MSLDRPVTDTPEDAYAPTRGRRQHVLQVLLDAMHPMSVAQVAQTCGIHLNTARFHLEILVRDGFAERRDEVRETPGRRKVLYTARPHGPGARRAQGFRLLAEMLTRVVATEVQDPDRVAFEAGRQWGRNLVPAPEPGERISTAEALERVGEEMDALWFAPEVRSAGEEFHLELNNCPFPEIAQAHPQVVCRLHVGLVCGTLSRLGAPAHVSSVTPWHRAHQCLAVVRPGAAGPGQAPELVLGHLVVGRTG